MNKQIIDNINLYPWGQLLNDATSTIRIENISWKSVSHYIFAKTLIFGINQVRISNIDDVMNIRNITKQLHQKEFVDIVKIACIDAIEQALVSIPHFKEVLIATVDKSLVYTPTNISLAWLLGGQNLLGEVLMETRYKYTNEANIFESPQTLVEHVPKENKNQIYKEMLAELGFYIPIPITPSPNVSLIPTPRVSLIPSHEEDSQLSESEQPVTTIMFSNDVEDPFFIFTLQYEIKLDGKPFNFGLEQYIYFILYKYITNSIDIAYRKCLELDYNTIHEQLFNEYIEQSINTSLVEALPKKFNDRYELYRILKSTEVTFETRNFDPYLANIIDPITNRILYDLKRKQEQIKPYDVINMDLLIQTGTIKDWIYKIRLPNILQTISFISKYYKVKADRVVENVILLLYYPCPSINLENILVDSYPSYFVHEVRQYDKSLFKVLTEGNENPSLYLIWCYITLLVQKLKQATKNIPFKDYLMQRRFNGNYTIQNIVLIIRKIIYLIIEIGKAVYIQVNITDETFELVQKILGISPIIKVSTYWDEFKIKMPSGISDIVPDIKLWNDIEKSLKILFPSILDIGIVSKKLYYLSEVIYAKLHKFNNIVHSRLYFYS